MHKSFIISKLRKIRNDMREILFRGKRIDNGEWVEGCLYIEKFPYKDVIKEVMIVEYRPDLRLVSGAPDNNHWWREVDPETVGQFTGLTDKNGVKIFECHKIKSFHGAIYDVHDMIEFHTWIERTFRGNPEFEVIGNIHDK